MYESDGVDEMWMNYKANHPTTWQDVKDFFKDLVFVAVVTVGVVWVPMLCIGAADAAVKKIKEVKEVRKEQKQKQQTEIKYEDALKMKNQITQDRPKIR
jgi:hypothetical protein